MTSRGSQSCHSRLLPADSNQTAGHMRNALFCGIAQRVVGNSYRSFGITVPSSGFKNPKESLQPQHGVYTGRNVGGKNVSVVWCQPVGLLQVAGWRGVWQSVVTSLPAHRYQQHWCHNHLTRLPTMKYRYNNPEPSTWTRTCPNVTLSTKNPTWTGLRSNQGLRRTA